MKLKKFLITFSLLFTIFTSGYGQSGEVKFLLDTTIAIMKSHAINARQVNWDTLRMNAMVKARNINDPYELGPVMRYLYASINDHHGAFFYKDSMFQWQANQPVVSDSIMHELKKGVRIVSAMLPQNIGYLRIPSMPGGSVEDFNASAQALNDSLCTLLKHEIKGMVLDLRLNGGGAMFPMILGVQQLLPQGFTGSFRTGKTENWYLKNNSFYIDTALLAKIAPKCNAASENIPVVILTSAITGSSAEFFIIAFKGRENTVLLGTRTAGFETINNGFAISDVAGLNLAIGYGADRNGKIYNHAIDPDIPVTGSDSFNDINNDVKVKAAIRWIGGRTR